MYLTEKQADDLIAERAAKMRMMRPGDLKPAVEFNWDCNGYYCGLKDHEDQWVVKGFIGAEDVASSFTEHLRQWAPAFDAVLKRSNP